MKSYEIIKFVDGDFSLDVTVSPLEKTLWLTQDQIAELFGKARSTVTEHIRNIFNEGELVEMTSVGNSDRSSHRPPKLFNLDVVLAVGYRVKSERGIVFRRWATNVLKQFMIKGYAVADNRCLECNNSILELKAKYLELEAKQNSSILFEPGDQLKAFLGVQKFLESAKREILIIDNYFGHAFDEVLKKIDVEKTIITNPNNSKIDTCEFYKVVKRNEFHDRFIIVDDYCYHFGASVEDIGKNISVGQRINEITIINFLKTFKK